MVEGATSISSGIKDSVLVCLGPDITALTILCPAHLVAVKHGGACPSQWVAALWTELSCLFSVRNCSHRTKKHEKSLLFVKKLMRFRQIPRAVWLHPEGRRARREVSEPGKASGEGRGRERCAFLWPVSYRSGKVLVVVVITVLCKCWYRTP